MSFLNFSILRNVLSIWKIDICLISIFLKFIHSVLSLLRLNYYRLMFSNVYYILNMSSMIHKQESSDIQCVQARAGHYGEEGFLFVKHLPCMHIFCVIKHMWVYMWALEEAEYKCHCIILTKCWWSKPSVALLRITFKIRWVYVQNFAKVAF